MHESLSSLIVFKSRLIWLSGNSVSKINEVKLSLARLVLGLAATFGHSHILSLTIPPWVGSMSTGDGFGHLWEETAPLKLRPHDAL